MTRSGSIHRFLLGALFCLGATLSAQEQAGSIRGVVFDADFEVPLPAAKVVVVETGAEATTSDGHA